VAVLGNHRVAVDSDTSIAELKARVQVFCEDRDWDQFHNAKDLAIGVATEAAELLERFRFQSDEQINEILEDSKRRTGVEEELADVLIFLLRFAQRFGFDLSAAVIDKLATNEERYPVATARGSNRKAGGTES
jgi:NTP pyrophosphatase (non-canonical NTP hydrolase)